MALKKHIQNATITAEETKSDKDSFECGNLPFNFMFRMWLHFFLMANPINILNTTCPDQIQWKLLIHRRWAVLTFHGCRRRRWGTWCWTASQLRLGLHRSDEKETRYSLTAINNTQNNNTVFSGIWWVSCIYDFCTWVWMESKSSFLLMECWDTTNNYFHFLQIISTNNQWIILSIKVMITSPTEQPTVWNLKIDLLSRVFIVWYFKA